MNRWITCPVIRGRLRRKFRCFPCSHRVFELSYAGVTDWLEPVVLPDVQQLPSWACGLDLRLRGNLARYRHGAGSG